MELIKIKDKTFEKYITEDKIQSVVVRIAKQLNADFRGKNPLFLAVLNGAFIYASDLLKHIDIPCEISFVKLASYSGTDSTGKIRELIGLNENLKGRTIVIVEDIIDTGLSMDYLMKELEALSAAEVFITALLLKPAALIKNIKIHYIGMEIPNDFIVGYGLDYDGQGRNYPDIYKIVN